MVPRNKYLPEETRISRTRQQPANHSSPFMLFVYRAGCVKNYSESEYLVVSV